jgi:hypothetical protein
MSWQNIAIQADEDVFRGGLGVIGSDLPVPVLVEDPRVAKLELRVEAAAPAVLLAQALVREGVLRIHVAPAHP